MANDTYLASLAASGADINRQVDNALREVNRQRDSALGGAAQLLPTTQNLGDQSRTTYLQDLAALQQAGGSNVGSQPFDQSLWTQMAGWQGAVPLVQQGVREMADSQYASANNLRTQLQTELAQRESQYRAQMEAEAQRRAFEAQQAELARQQQQQLAAQQIAAQQAALAAQARQAELDRQHQASLAEMARNEQNFYAKAPGGGLGYNGASTSGPTVLPPGYRNPFSAPAPAPAPKKAPTSVQVFGKRFG